MPSSLTRVISLILGFSPRLPVSVCGTGASSLDSSFSRQCEFSYFDTYVLSPSHIRIENMYFTLSSPSVLGPALPLTGLTYPPVSLPLSNNYERYRNLNLLSIAYDFRPRLRSRLTLGGRAFPRNPQAFGGSDSHRPYRLLMPAFSLLCAPRLLSVPLQPTYYAPLPHVFLNTVIWCFSP